jgi:hypothetical protein
MPAHAVEVVDGAKACCTCEQTKPVSEFHRDRHTASGYANRCKECRRPGNATAVARWRERHPERRREAWRRWWHNKGRFRDLAATYGISEEQYLAMLEAQDGRCAICRGDGQGRRLGVDHDHDTGQVRGLLCGPCNSALGMLREDPAIFAAALTYLEGGGPHG